jgi:N-methylhydantoinase A
LQDVYGELAEQASTALGKEGFPADERRYLRTADLRYFGQAFEVRVPVPEGALDQSVLDGVAATFHAEHRALYGYDFSTDPHQQVEWVNLRVSGIGPIRRPEIVAAPPESGPVTGGDGAPRVRAVCFDAAEGYVDTPVHWRPDLRPGTTVVGPAILEEFGSTIPLHPGFTARVDPFRNVVVTREGQV